ncbi:Serine threonine protein kinase [Apiospora saccharicola]|uniref:Serine threonine protein kinase n=1 Tax=Apiospora saccharicola TaxID=335842 RepID=A0ABR1VKX0_9PEZI
MSDDQGAIVYQHYYPPGVKRVIASGSSAFIGEIDEYTVLKYPLSPTQATDRLEVEKKLLEIVGPHERILQLKGVSERGIYLERAINGNLADYLLDPDHLAPSISQRLSWCRQAAEAVAFVHSRNIIHCDIQPTNLLLNKELHLKLSDFQGKHLLDGEILLDGWSSEPSKFYCPRADPFEASIKTDLFALGCTIYFIMMGHAVFPDIQEGEEGWHEMVEERFTAQRFPQDEHLCGAITMKCWLKEYKSAEQLVRDLHSVEQSP